MTEIASVLSIARIWDAAVALYGSNPERPLQVVFQNTAPDGAPYFLIGILPGESRPVLVSMESRIPFVVGPAEPPAALDDVQARLGRVSVIRGDMQEAEFADIREFLAGMGMKGTPGI